MPFLNFKPFSKSYSLNLILHAFFMLLFVGIIFNANPDFPNYYSKHMRQLAYMLLTGIAFFYIHSLVLMQLLLVENDKRKYYSYTLGCIFILILIELWFGGSLFNMQKDLYKGTFILIGLLSIVILSSFLYGFIHLKINASEQSFNLKIGAKESELKLLKSQVNPHFLFNTLNTLYAVSLKEDATKTGEGIAKLASLIRYMQEDINKEFIPLENEIRYLKDYISIQKLRCEIIPNIELDIQKIEDYRISPGLLIPFVENAFKYGIDPSKPSTLKLSISCDKNKINFSCLNSYDEEYQVYHKEKGFGIGIKNAKQRLTLVYPKKHTFEIKKENNIFSVNISINTKKT